MRAARRTLTVILVLSFVTLVLTAGAAWANGYRLYAVTSGSMQPTIAVGDLLVVAPPADGYAVGDVVTFPSPLGARRAVTTHRVDAVLAEERLRTKGDANDTPDPTTVAVETVLGRTLAVVPGAGYPLVFFRQPTGVAGLVTAMLSTTLLWSLFFAAPTAPAAPTVRVSPAALPGARTGEVADGRVPTLVG